MDIVTYAGQNQVKIMTVYKTQKPLSLANFTITTEDIMEFFEDGYTKIGNMSFSAFTTKLLMCIKDKQALFTYRDKCSLSNRIEKIFNQKDIQVKDALSTKGVEYIMDVLKARKESEDTKIKYMRYLNSCIRFWEVGMKPEYMVFTARSRRTKNKTAVKDYAPSTTIEKSCIKPSVRMSSGLIAAIQLVEEEARMCNAKVDIYILPLD